MFAGKERGKKRSIWVKSWKATRGEEGAFLTVLAVTSPLALVLFS